MARALDIQPLQDTTFGAVVRCGMVTDLDEPTFRELYATWLKYALLIFPDHFLKRDEQIAFARRFGPLEFEMAAISNVKADGTLRLEKDNDDMMKVLKATWAGMPIRPTCRCKPRAQCSAPRSCRRSAGAPAGPTCAPLTMPSIPPRAPGSKGCRPTIRCTTARQSSATAPRSPTANTAATASTTGQCRFGRWSRPIPRPAASRC